MERYAGKHHKEPGHQPCDTPSPSNYVRSPGDGVATGDSVTTSNLAKQAPPHMTNDSLSALRMAIPGPGLRRFAARSGPGLWPGPRRQSCRVGRESPALKAHGSGGRGSAVRRAARLMGRFGAWSASGPRASSASSSRSSDWARSARWMSTAAAARWCAACRSCWSLSPNPAAARSYWRAACSWAAAALRDARILAAIA